MGLKLLRFPLNAQWSLIQADYNLNLPVEIPSTVFETLINQEVIEDPFYGVQENEVAWVYNSDWVYQLYFDSPVKIKTLRQYEHIILRFNGLDTIAEVRLNETLLGLTTDTFQFYEFDVKDVIRNKENILEVRCQSPTKIAREYIEKSGVKLTAGSHALPGVPYLRKAQYSFGWDWGPKLPDIGIWQSVELIAFSARILSVFPRQDLIYNCNPDEITDPTELSVLQVDQVHLDIQVELETSPDLLKDLQVKVEIFAPDSQDAIISIVKPVSTKDMHITTTLTNPLLWYTNDIGMPHLYLTQVYLLQNEECVDILSQNLGIREIRVIQRKDQWGESFYLRLNGIPLFAKGADWIPVDTFVPRGVKLGLYEKNVQYAQEVGMNMIRVWGGGYFELDRFYDACDQLGILVWQDFPFACALYPPDQEFLENVRQESIQNIKRIHHHASLGMWCGNNEIEWLYARWAMQVFNPLKRRLYKSRYIEIFERLLPQLLADLDPQTFYWPSSPSNGGVLKAKTGLNHSNSPRQGDAHYWKVWHSNYPFSAYRDFTPRFMSEFGFESFPSLKTLARICPSDQWDFYSPVMENHQKNPAGNKKIMQYMARRFSIPQKFSQQVILSQITQGEAVEYGVEDWRRHRTNFQCMGTIYWQLNDCWPVASWASVDYYGRWKALHYLAKRFYAPVFASVLETKTSVECWVTNDLACPVGGTFVWTLFEARGEVVKEETFPFTVPPCSAKMLQTFDLREVNRNHEFQHHIIFYHIYNEQGQIMSRGFRLFDDPKVFPLEDPVIRFSIVNAPRGPIKEVNLSIFAEQIALFVYIDSTTFDFIASDNFFALQPRETREINLRLTPLNEDLTVEEFTETLEVGSLWHLLHS